MRDVGLESHPVSYGMLGTVTFAARLILDSTSLGLRPMSYLSQESQNIAVFMD